MNLNNDETVNLDESISFDTFQYYRVITPTIIQLEITECSAVCLAIILAYYGKFVSIEELRGACNVTRDGSNGWNIVTAAKSYQLEAHGYSVDPNDVKSIALPAIIFWEFEHFVVLEGYGKDCFYINDPAVGPYSIPSEDFYRLFSKLAIELTPSSKFLKSGEPPNFIKLLYALTKKTKLPLLFIFLTALGMVVPTLLLTAISRIFVDQVLANEISVPINALLLSLIFAMILIGILSFLKERILIFLKSKLSLRMSSSALWHMLRLPFQFFNNRYPGEVAYRISLIDPIVDSLTGELAITVLDLFLISIYGLALAYYSPLFALIVFCAGFINLMLLQRVFRLRQDSLARYQATSGKNIGYSLGLLENLETIKGMGMEEYYFANWAGYYTTATNAFRNIQKKDISLHVVPIFINALTMMALLGISGFQVLDNRMTIGMFVSMQILLISFMAPMIRLTYFTQIIQLLKINLFRFNDLMLYPQDIDFEKEDKNAKEAHTYEKLEGQIKVRNITYGYSLLEPPLINNISFSIQPGQSLALVGISGCGKSTVASLVAGLIHPWKGEILFDGKPLSQLSNHSFTSSLAYIEQSPFLFKGSVKENLSLRNPLISEKALIRAAEDACIHDDIMAKRGGYEFEIEDNGINLSGGQRQRLEIARGLLKNPTILVLDECTSALDADIEKLVLKNIIQRGCAILMIAHRLSTIKNCDEICVMDKGKIVARGTHQQLKETSELYRELVHIGGTPE